MPIQKYPQEMKAFIVQRLACFDAPSEVVQAVKEHFGIEIEASYTARYNPLLTAFSAGEELRQLFHDTRRRFVEGLYDVGIVHKQYRLRRLDEMERRARTHGEYVLAAQLLKQAAEEVGGAYEKNRGGLTLETLQKTMDELAGVVAQNVRDPEVLRRIDEAWARLGEGGTAGRIQQAWPW